MKLLRNILIVGLLALAAPAFAVVKSIPLRNADITVPLEVYAIATVDALTAPRTIYLPSAGGTQIGQSGASTYYQNAIVFYDQIQTITVSNTITFIPQTDDTINGAASLVVSTPGAIVTLAPTHPNKWSASISQPGNFGTVTSVTIVAGAGISVSGTCAITTSGSCTVTRQDEFTTGDYKLTMKTSADSGWILLNDGTIGSAASGASTRANADTAALYTLLWTNCSDANCAVSTGRGANAAADFAANKTLATPKVLGRTLAVSGSGSGLTTRVLGSALGAETVTLADVNLAHHAHVTSTISGFAISGLAGTAIQLPGAAPTNALTANLNTQVTDPCSICVATPFNIMNPTGFGNVMMKL